MSSRCPADGALSPRRHWSAIAASPVSQWTATLHGEAEDRGAQVTDAGETAGQRHWAAWVREDISEVVPLGSYAAKRCPVRTQLDVLRPVEPAPVSQFLAMLGRRGHEFEGEVVAALADAGDVRDVTAQSREELVAATVTAMEHGEPVIAGGRLPIDPVGRRVGEPDLLVRVGDEPLQGRWRYAPVDVKSHKVLTDPDTGTAVVVQDLAELQVPDADAVEDDIGRQRRTTRDDTLQLAHYHRLLEACGHAAAGVAWGGIIGSEGRPVWYRLDTPRWSTPTADPEQRSKHRTALEVYDFEFGFRLDIAAVAMRHAEDPSVPLLVEPVECHECSNCPWREHCLPQLEQRRDVSLLPRVSFTVWQALQDAGLGSFDALAGAGADVEVEGLSASRLEELQVQARARIHDAPVLVRGGDAPVVSLADVEVDVDMENDFDGAYLWGAHVTSRGGVEVAEPGYHAFASWDSPFGEDARAGVFLRFWDWLQTVRRNCDEQGLTFAAFCWYEAAENQYLRDGAALSGRSDEVEDFIASPDWIDLHHWFTSHYVTGHGNGLKAVASLLGFAWRDDDPGGASSMAWRARAIDPSVDPAEREAARKRLLAYNEDDVRATLAVRDALAEMWGTRNG